MPEPNPGAEPAETTPSGTGEEFTPVTDSKELDSEFGFEPEPSGREADKDHPEKDGKKPEGTEKDHPEGGEKPPEGAEKPAEEGEKTPQAEKLYAGKYKSPEDLEKAYSEIQTLQLKQVEGSKTEKAEFEKQIKTLKEQIDNYQSGKIVPGTGLDMLNQLMAKDPDNKAHYEEMHNALGEEAFRSWAIIENSRLDKLNKEFDKFREKDNLAELERQADRDYAAFAEKYPEAKDEKVKEAITNIVKEFFDENNANDPIFIHKACLDILHGRKSAEDFAKAVSDAAKIEAEKIVQKNLSEGLLVRKSASIVGTGGKSEEEKELDREYGITD